MKRYIIKGKFVLLTFLLFVGSSCEKDFLDINTDPNNPTDAPLSQILPFAQLSIVNYFGSSPNGLTDVAAQLVHQTVQRGPVNFYQVTGGENSITFSWPGLYAGALTDLREIINKGTKNEGWLYVGIAQLLKAYAFSMMVDVWGDIPYFEANKGNASPFPTYDRGEEVYKDLFLQIDEALTNLQKPSKLTPGADDLIYQGSVEKWRRFGKTLKLKMYNQVRLTSLYNAAEVVSLINEGDLMLANGDFELTYGNSQAPETRHPAFFQEYTQGGPFNKISPYFYLILKGDATFNDVLERIRDPRIPYYFYNQLAPNQPSENPVPFRDGGFIGMWFASFNIDPNEGFDQSRSQTLMGLYPIGGSFDNGRGGVGNQNSGLQGAGTQRLLTYFSRLYTQSELALEGGAPGDPRVLLEQAIRASFEEVNEIAARASISLISAGEIDTYVAAVLEKYDVANNEGKLELIITQKWIASFGFAVDAYTDYRRTGYPFPFDPNTDNNPVTILSRTYPLSFPYYTQDREINPNAPQQRNPATDPVFWDR